MMDQRISFASVNATSGTKATFIEHYACEIFQGSALALAVDGIGIFIYSSVDFKCLKSWLVDPSVKFVTLPTHTAQGVLLVATSDDRIAKCGEDQQISWISTPFAKVISISQVAERDLLLIVGEDRVFLLDSLLDICEEDSLEAVEGQSLCIGVGKNGFPVVLNPANSLATMITVDQGLIKQASIQVPEHSSIRVEGQIMLLSDSSSVTVFSLEQEFSGFCEENKRKIPIDSPLDFIQPISEFFFLAVASDPSKGRKIQIRDLTYGIPLVAFDLKEEFGELVGAFPISNSTLALVSSTGSIWTLESALNFDQISLSILLGIQQKQAQGSQLTDQELMEGLESETISTWNTPALVERVFGTHNLHLTSLFLSKARSLTAKEIVSCLEKSLSGAYEEALLIQIIDTQPFLKCEMCQALKALAFDQIERLFILFAQCPGTEERIVFLECLVSSHFVDWVLAIKREGVQIVGEFEQLKKIVIECGKEMEACMQVSGVVSNLIAVQAIEQKKKCAKKVKAPYVVENISF